MGEPAQDESQLHRRQAPRVDLEVEVNFNEHSNFYVGFSENISEGGLFIATYDLKPVGTQVALKFTLPDGSEIDTSGVVRWTRDPRDNAQSEVPPGLGIQFEGLSEAHKTAIREFTELQPPMFYPD